MTAKTQLRLAVIGPSGSGKSTVANGLIDVFTRLGFSCGVCKLARPLYQLQQAFYDVAGQQIARDGQDQVLLETIATRLRAISPTSLVDDMMRRLKGAREDVVLNDDLRDCDVDWPRLRELDFRIVRVVTQETTRLRRLHSRNDVSILDHSELDLQIAKITPDFVVANVVDDMQRLQTQLNMLARHMLDEQRAPRRSA